VSNNIIFVRRSKKEIEINNIISQYVSINTTPSFSYRFDYMKVGVLKDIDRDYTFDVIPDEIQNGILYQPIHRIPYGTSTKLTVSKECTIYFIFHNECDGNYTEIFKEMGEWTLCSSAPQYDLEGKNGDPTHGLNMTMYKLNAKPGVYDIPAGQHGKATSWACWNIVITNLK
jgi:hypothetical protein